MRRSRMRSDDGKGRTEGEETWSKGLEEEEEGREEEGGREKGTD